MVVQAIFSPGGKVYKSENLNIFKLKHFSSAISLIVKDGLGIDGVCHLPHPVGNEVNLPIEEKNYASIDILQLSANQNIYSSFQTIISIKIF